MSEWPENNFDDDFLFGEGAVVFEEVESDLLPSSNGSTGGNPNTSNLIDSQNVQDGMDLLLDGNSATGSTPNNLDYFNSNNMTANHNVHARSMSIGSDVWSSSSKMNYYHTRNTSNYNAQMEWNMQNGGNDSGMTFGGYPQGGMYKLQAQAGDNGQMGMGEVNRSGDNQSMTMKHNQPGSGVNVLPPDDLGAFRGGIPMNHLRKYTGLNNDSFQKYRMNPVPGGGLPSDYTDTVYPNSSDVPVRGKQQSQARQQLLQQHLQQQQLLDQSEMQARVNIAADNLHNMSPNMDMFNDTGPEKMSPRNISTVQTRGIDAQMLGNAPQNRLSSLPQGGLHNPQLQARMMMDEQGNGQGNMYSEPQRFQQIQQQQQRQGMRHGFSIHRVVNRNPLEPSPRYLQRMQQKNLEHVLEQQASLQRQQEEKHMARMAEIEAVKAKAEAEAVVINQVTKEVVPNIVSDSIGKEITDASATEPEADDDDYGFEEDDDEEEGQQGNKKVKLSRQQNVDSVPAIVPVVSSKSVNIKEEVTVVNTLTNTSNTQESTEVKAKEKNREHAKNTRMRKKTYIESLKDQVKEMSESREQLDQARRMALLNKANLVDSRKKVISDFLICRTYGELDPIIWSKFLDKNFDMTLPVTPYRSFPPTEVCEGRRLVRGIPAVIADTASLAVLFKTVGNPCNDGFFCRAQFYSLNEETISSEDRIMCKWYMCTENAVERGADSEITKQGMLVAHFAPAPSNMLLRLDMNFDVMNFMQQLRRANGALEFQVVPNIFRVAVDMTHVADIRMLVHYSKENPEHMFIHTVSKVSLSLLLLLLMSSNVF